MRKSLTAIIPARYASTRLPGKPLRDINGKPMIWWVWNTVRQISAFDEVAVATEDERIVETCLCYGIKCLLTSDHPDSRISRMHEVSLSLEGDRFICVNGDEPTLSRNILERFVEHVRGVEENIYLLLACSPITDPTQIADFSKIKIVTDKAGRVLYMSRSPIPYPRGTSLFTYKRFVGLECFSREALAFFAETPMPMLEKIEDIDGLRFIEHGKPIRTIEVNAGEVISVDTEKDLERVRLILSRPTTQDELMFEDETSM